MESALIDEAVKALNEGETAARSRHKLAKAAPSLTKFPAGTEWEILHADALVLQGLTYALSETYYGQQKLSLTVDFMTFLNTRIPPNSVRLPGDTVFTWLSLIYRSIAMP